MALAALSPYDGWLARITKVCESDPEAGRLRKLALNENRNKSEQYVLRHGVLMWSARGLLRVYVPIPLRLSLIKEFHDTAISGHFGTRKTYAATAQHYYWPRMIATVKHYVARCATCQRVKATRQPTPPIQPHEVPSRPFECITLDWLSGFPLNAQGHDSVLNVVDKFSKWAIVVPCDKHMTTQMLVDTLYTRVFSWVGLPSKIVGDRDSRLTASQMRALVKGLSVKLNLSVAYHPQTDGQTEQFNSTLLQMLRSFVNKYHSDWAECIPALLYAYHNTVHAATGYTPHRLLFGWCPRDLRAPLFSEFECDAPDIERWLHCRKRELHQAHVTMEHARQAMIRAQKASAKAHVYHVDDLVKVSTRVLPLRCTSTQVDKLQPRYIGPFKVLSVLGKVLHLELPASYDQVHPKFNIEDVRPWLSGEHAIVDIEYPPVEARSNVNPVVQILDRKRLPGRQPRRVESVLEIPCQYSVVRRNGDVGWVKGILLTEREERQHIKKFELRFRRSEALPCNPVRAYSVSQWKETDPASDDELDIVLHVELDEHLGLSD
jgi:hypothetical protein